MAYYQNNMFNHLIQSDASQGFSIDDDDSDSALGASNGASVSQTYPWSNYSLPQLRELLRQRGQLTTGSKSALKKRLKNLDRAATKSESSLQPTTTIDIVPGQSSQQESTTPLPTVSKSDPGSQKSEEEGSKRSKSTHPLRSRISSRSNSFSAHFAEFINRRRVALETERQEISVYTSPLTVLSYFFLYLLHEFRMLLVWIVSQQYLLVVLPLLTAAVYFVYQTDGAHQPLLKHAESGMI
ncbi:hypothetical protein BGX28_000916, partial [Mortierella sp. GBA30]